nr:putative toxin-antitoxin system toxin component, PIN family [Aphanothece hegewaldii]
MKLERRFVFDVNVIVSAFLFEKSKPDQALGKAQNMGFVLVSNSIAMELREVLLRPKFARYLSLERRLELENNFIEATQIIEPTHTIEICRDPKDNKYLELAVSGKAEAIITGDEDLLVLNPFRGIIILTPQEFLNR